MSNEFLLIRKMHYEKVVYNSKAWYISILSEISSRIIFPLFHSYYAGRSNKRY